MDEKRLKKIRQAMHDSPVLAEALQRIFEKQRQAFIAKFGREPGQPGDPVFFGPDADKPRPISEEKLDRQIREDALSAGLDPDAIAAYFEEVSELPEDVRILLAEQHAREFIEHEEGEPGDD